MRENASGRTSMGIEETGKILAFSPESEGALCLVSGLGLEVFVFRAGAHDREQALTPRSPLQYGLFVWRDVPFFLIRIQGLGEFAVGVNFPAQPADRLQAFMDLRGEGACRLLLCGFPKPFILGERIFGVREDVMREMREIGHTQAGTYADAGECAAAMTGVMGRLGAGRMIRSTVMYPDKPVV